ncbi:MAG: phosphotransferase family protein [Acidimicrobiales bacterium]|nr:phosphotransferase family protein [Acidimicrobiales bacterium]
MAARIPQGIDDPGITAWFGAHVPDARPPLAYDLIAGGHSNLTFRVTDSEGQAWALRRPPLHQVLATAHDMAREHRIMFHLAPTPVPVPLMRGLCEDHAVNGRPFYVMDWVDGHVVRSPRQALELDPQVRRAASTSIASTLAAIHAVDVDVVGLGDLGKREDYISRQLRRWSRQFHDSKTRERPEIDAVHDHLVARIPEQRYTGIVHGDYRLDNCIIDDDGTVLAVLDWELCTLGDQMADIAQLLVYWAEPDDPTTALADPPTLVDGFASRSELLADYATASGRPVDDIAYYLAFAYWKVACIIEGVYSRYVGGAMGDKVTADVEAFARAVDGLTEQAVAAAERIA